MPYLFRQGKFYVDLIDIKPPLIYYFYSIVYFIFGSSEFALRLFDFFFQFMTVCLLFSTIRKATGNIKLSGISALIFSLSYTIQGHNQTMQIESYMPLLTLLIVRLMLEEKQKISKLIVVGALAGIITAFKFTMFFVIFIVPLSDYLIKQKSIGETTKRFLWSIAGFVIAIALTLIPFLDSEVRNGFSGVLTYLSYYSQIPPINIEFFRTSIKVLGNFFGDKYSLLISISLVLGIIRFGKLNREKTVSNNFAAVLLSLVFLLGISIIVERKFFEYHFSRLYAVFSIFAGAGVIFIYDSLKALVKDWRRNYFTAVFIGIILIVMSPVARWIAILQPTVEYFSNGEGYDNYYERPFEGSAVLRFEHKATADYIIQNSSMNDKTLVVSVASSIVNYHLNELAYNRFMLSCFFISNEKISQWVETAYDELQKSRWLVLQENDPSGIANHHSLSSRQYMLQDKKFGSYIQSNFHQVKVIGNFHIYEKNATY